MKCNLKSFQNMFYTKNHTIIHKYSPFLEHSLYHIECIQQNYYILYNLEFFLNKVSKYRFRHLLLQIKNILLDKRARRYLEQYHFLIYRVSCIYYSRTSCCIQHNQSLLLNTTSKYQFHRQLLHFKKSRLGKKSRKYVEQYLLLFLMYQNI